MCKQTITMSFYCFLFSLQSGPTFSNSAWGKRTRLEKMLFVVVALLVAALAVVLSMYELITCFHEFRIYEFFFTIFELKVCKVYRDWG